jgi:S-adenosylmethionine/arginine decarboxylase-like enzyme
MLRPWGYMLSIDAAKCLPPAIRCPKHIECFTKKLVKEIDMTAYGKPQIVMFGEGNKRGYTLSQLITTSNITAHFCEEDNAFFLDIFSCKPFDKEVAKRVIQHHFYPKIMVEHYFERYIHNEVSRPDLP